MAEKIVNARFQTKTDTSANWAKVPNFIPKYGEIIGYSDLKKVKMGDGVTKISLLPFAYSDVMNKINEMKTVDVTADNPDDSVSIWIDPDEDGDIFTAAQGTPTIANSTSEMIDVNKLYVLTTNQHIYYYNGTAWTDSGMTYTGATVVQETGTSTTDVMSQKAVTNELNGLKSKLEQLRSAIGDILAKLENGVVTPPLDSMTVANIDEMVVSEIENKNVSEVEV